MCINGCVIRERAFGSEPGPEGLTRRLLKEIDYHWGHEAQDATGDGTTQVISPWCLPAGFSSPCGDGMAGFWA